jgi:hypothetical protein
LFYKAVLVLRYTPLIPHKERSSAPGQLLQDHANFHNEELQISLRYQIRAWIISWTIGAIGYNMSAQSFIVDLTTLSQESKRRNPELKQVGAAASFLCEFSHIKQAAETSLQEIKAIQVTSEKQLAAGKFSWSSTPSVR